MDSENRKRKLEIAARRNKGKQLLNEFLEDVASLDYPDRPVRIIDLEATDELWARYQSRLEACSEGSYPCNARIWQETEISDLSALIANFKNRVSDTPIYVFRALSEYCGAVQSTTHSVLVNALRLISLDQEDLMATDQMAEHGLLLEFYTFKGSGAETREYRLLVWGEEWLKNLDPDVWEQTHD